MVASAMSKITNSNALNRASALRQKILHFVNHPRYKQAQKIVWSTCMLWAGITVVQSIPYYIYVSEGKSAFTEGRYDQAEDLFSLALNEADKENPVLTFLHIPDPRLATALNNLGELYRKESKFDKAAPIYARLLKNVESLDKKKQEQAVGLNSVAAFYRDKGDFAEAEKLCRRAVSIWETDVKKLKDANYGGLLAGLARVYKEEGRYKEAESLYEKALSIKQKALGPDHQDVAAALASVGGLYRKEGKYAESENAYRRALQIDLRDLGGTHADTAADQNNLASLFRETARYTDAQQLYAQALNTRKIILGMQHHDTARTLLGIAELRLAQGQYKDAAKLAQQALTIDKAIYGTDEHPDCADCYKTLSVAYRMEGKFALAGQNIDKCLKIRQQRLPAEHPDLAEAYFNKAELLRLQNNKKAAADLYMKAKVIQEKELIADHPALLASIEALKRTGAKK